MPGALAGRFCPDSGHYYCEFGCCRGFAHYGTSSVCCEGKLTPAPTTYSPSSVVESTVNLAVIIGASVGGFLLLVVIVSVVLCIVCCTKTNRGQAGQVVQGQTMVVAGSYPMQTNNMQPGINQLQQQPYYSNTTPNLQSGASQWQQQPQPYIPPGEEQDSYKMHQQPPANYP
ncbi:hypothetical protein DPMN_099259 [Dreissena polymorpha]|uniref:Cysteine and tyrosine-rich protein 1 n=2 Tax=Dreissena polymorpha TaxID=45954 RepID=A0A9D4R7H2_DREPO|nr:hypothetical protein DPMN_099259 [Dreissena polymorpha]